ncbi:MAG: PorP/SprF family type IX secretion system membrane protein [Bacteroidia bacterium]|nr:PorP/SprF family type IX secretion system membrane protein [Bacteroidia bacterium]
MKNFYSAVLLLVITAGARAQDVPLFTQKLSNSFLYNPSVAGNGLGSLTFSYRQYWSGIEGSPHTSFLSLHTPLAKHKIGFGINVFQDNVGVSKTLIGSAALAYHIQINDDNAFSMGLSAEYGNFRTGGVDVIDTDDPLLLNGFQKNEIDFSFGLSYQSKYFSAGAAANRLTALVGIKDHHAVPRVLLGVSSAAGCPWPTSATGSSRW